ncbi:nime/cyclinb [Ephemerocybe angulata]|uniref:Nime/cyclinb n=1 Tax=Ephemerocybe angulata TaxID=980116 RepID=A0A8H6I307_9AGAR|nr:nime/cyclinb [Tulosesus angulatus]
MSSTFDWLTNLVSQTRRTTRSTRTMKDPENAVVRSTRATALRASSIAKASAQASSATTRAASKAKANRRRGGECRQEEERGVGRGAKGKEKEGVAAKGAVAEKPTIAAPTRVLRRAGSAAPGASRIAKPKAVEATETKKVAPVAKRAESKPPSTATSTTQVFRDPPATKATKRKDEEEVVEAPRETKRRHMDAIVEVEAVVEAVVKVEAAVEAVVEAPQAEESNASQLEADKIASELVKVEESLFEPEPEDQLWDDLDADDWDDPVMVSEYVVDVCKYWKELELATLPKADYMDHQSEINWEHRGILVDWIIQVHSRFSLLPESLYLSVNLMDRFLSARPISLNKLQLVGLACFFIATKFEETCAPSVTEIVFLSDNQYTVAEVLKAEMYILRILNWDLRSPGPMNWLRRGSKADDCDGNARTVAKYLTEIACLERRLVAVVPSLIAASALWIGRLTCGRDVWTPTLEHYSTFSEEEIYPIAGIMLEYVLSDPVQHESLYTKYAHKKYMKCSVYIRQWASERWGVNKVIDLAKDVESLKASVREALRQAELAAEHRAARAKARAPAYEEAEDDCHYY